MANFINEAVIDAAAAEYAQPIADVAVRLRLQALFADILRNDSSCARAPGKRALAAAPEWARERIAAGEAVHVFRASPRAAASAMRLASDIALALEPFDVLAPCERPFAQLRADFIAKIGKMCAQDIARAASTLANTRQRILEDRAYSTPIYGAEFVAATPGRTWSMVRAPIALSFAGEALQNCLRRKNGHFVVYAREMMCGAAVFWTLNERDAIVAIARVDARTGLIVEFRGKHNAAPMPFLQDLPSLMRAKGYVSACDYLGVRLHMDARAAEALAVRSGAVR